MQKLNKTFRMNPLYESDSYKVGHKWMLADFITRSAWNWIPRSLKYMHPSINQIMSAGEQLTWRYIHSTFQENFFDMPITEATRFVKDMNKHLMIEYNGDHFIELHKLGYLPITIQALPEGLFTNPNIPHMQGINTVHGYAWLNLYLETLVSKLSWQLPTVATIGHKFKENAVKAVTKTDPENLWLADFMCHDFHSRGGNPFTSIAAGLGHIIGGNKGGDTLNVIPASRYYYDFNEDEVPTYSVNASEHSVTTTRIFFFEKKLKAGKLNHEIELYYSYDLPCDGSVEDPDYLAIAEWLNLRGWIKKCPSGVLSYVADTFNLWKLINFIVARLKDDILARDGKLVLRPDSGDPVDIICGTNAKEIQTIKRMDVWTSTEKIAALERVKRNTNESVGVVELLWNIFGGEETSTGYKRLNSHIGVIYGDSITLERQTDIYEKLGAKTFSATSAVLGIGSYSYVYMTRDNAGYAAKGSWFETITPADEADEMSVKETFNIYKDPITDDGTKKSLKGFQFVYKDEDGIIKTEGEVSEEKAFSEDNLLKVIYSNGKFFNQTTIESILEVSKQYGS